MPMEHIERLTKEHAHYRDVLAERVRSLHEELDTAKRRRLPGIKSAVSEAKDSRLRLEAAIGAERELFVKPKTRVLHGIKVGLQKAKGKLRFEDAKNVVKLIRKHLEEQFDLLVKTTEKPVKNALLQLPAEQLKKIGCTIEGTGDVIVVESADSEIDKLVDALLDEKRDEEQDE